MKDEMMAELEEYKNKLDSELVKAKKIIEEYETKISETSERLNNALNIFDEFAEGFADLFENYTKDIQTQLGMIQAEMQKEREKYREIIEWEKFVFAPGSKSISKDDLIAMLFRHCDYQHNKFHYAVEGTFAQIKGQTRLIYDKSRLFRQKGRFKQ